MTFNLLGTIYCMICVIYLSFKIVIDSMFSMNYKHDEMIMTCTLLLIGLIGAICGFHLIL